MIVQRCIHKYFFLYIVLFLPEREGETERKSKSL